MRSRRPSGQLPAVSSTSDPFTVFTVKQANGLITTTATGTAKPNLAARLRIQLMAELDNEQHDWLIDAAGLEKFDREASVPFVEVLGAFKNRNGNRVLIITGDALKMMFSTINMSSVASGGPAIEIIASMEEAMMRLGGTDGRKAGTE